MTIQNRVEPCSQCNVSKDIMKKALILHGWFCESSQNWYPWLKKELEKKGYLVDLPDIPELRKDVPDQKKILKSIIKNNKIDKDTTVIGHSLGSVLAMRLGERKKFKKMILISGWDFDDLTEGHKKFWETKINHAKIKNNVKEIVVIHSDSDPYITAFLAEEMSKRLNGKFVLIKGAGHFQEKDGITQIPKLLEIV